MKIWRGLRTRIVLGSILCGMLGLVVSWGHDPAHGAGRDSGSGLGLAITSEICGRCGWKLSFEPHEPRGLRVSIAGPTVPAPAP